MSASASRFRDPTSSSSLVNLARHPIDVVCPRCAAHAQVIVDPAAGQTPLLHSRRLVCPGCGHTASWLSRGRSSWWGAAYDPFFRQPLWLTAAVRGHRLWAYNGEHLALLAEFVAAALRERGPEGRCSMSMIERLPVWMKSAGNRDAVLAAVARLRSRVDDPGRPTTTRRRPPATAGDLRRCGAREHR